MDHSAFVLDQVAKTGRRFLTRSDCVVIQCPIHANGQERTPSRKINLSNPRFKPLESFCYGCNDDDKRLTWNELAARCNMAPIRTADDNDGDEDDGDGLWLSLPSSEEFYGAEAEDVAHFKWKGNWRGISHKLLKRLGVSLVNSKDEPRIYFPIYVDGEQIGNVQCVVEVNEESHKIKYLISKENRWSQYTLYPVDIAYEMAEQAGYIVIVEGLRDALKLIQLGVPAVCIWGTNAWTRAKLDALIELDVKLIVAMDGDEPGRGARDKIVADLKRHKVPHAVINFEEDMDPGKMPKADILELKRMFDKRKPANDNFVSDMLNLFRRKRRG
jgi:5S rRNA maturation endonuclease (ribonuclease M5)